MTNEHKQPRSREGEKFIPESKDGPYQFDIDSSGEKVISLPNGEVIVRTSLDELIDAMASLVFAEASLCVSRFGEFQLALSNSPLLEPLYERLMYDPIVRGIPWQNTFLWCVDPYEMSSNIVKETIVDHADIPDEQIHDHLPEKSEGKKPPRIDCLIVDSEASIPEDCQTRFIIIVSKSVEACEMLAKTCHQTTVRGFVLQENR
ncbi:MAG: hypothetical protein QF444_02140 [Phycisphaerales bacterium]|nr:hypothetical protein [Phycisphaerales bacterium]